MMLEGVERDMQKTPSLGADLFRARHFILSGFLFGLAAALAVLFFSVPLYRAQMIVSPANPMNGAEVSSLLANDNLYALRYLVQRTGVAGSSDFMRFENTYDGAAVSELLIKDGRIKDAVNRDVWFRFTRAADVSTPENLSVYLRKNIRLEPVGGTPMRRVVYWHPDPELAAYLLHAVHKATDELIRWNIRQAASQRIEYLNKVLGETNNPDHRRALTTLLEEQERLRMLVSIETPYAASVVEPPSTSPESRWPDRKLFLCVFSLCGAFLGWFVFGLFPRRSSRYQ